MNSTWLRARMYHLRVTQAQIAQEWGVDHSQVSRWIKTGYALPVARLGSLAQLLQMSMQDLIAKLEEPDQPQPTEAPPVVSSPGSTNRYPTIEVRDREGTVVDHVPAPPRLAKVPGAYALLVQDAKLEPRARPGDILYIHPALPAQPGDLCVDKYGHPMVAGKVGDECRKVVTIDPA